MRAAPKPVSPIFYNNIRYEIEDDEVERFGQSGGIIRAVDLQTNAELWTSKVYEIKYDASYEKDVQEIYINKLELDISENLLRVQNERRRWFFVRISDGVVVASGGPEADS